MFCILLSMVLIFDEIHICQYNALAKMNAKLFPDDVLLNEKPNDCQELFRANS